MKKALFCFFIALAGFLPASADHITGGQMFYTLAGKEANGSYNYNFTLKLFMRCNSGRQFNNPTIIAVYDKGSGQRILQKSVYLTNSQTTQLLNPDPCISDPPNVCYEVGLYLFDLNLPPSSSGYIVSSQVNYRINNISNLQSGYANVGATYTAEIPGTTPVGDGPANNSANFVGNDLVIICADNPFQYDFSAVDADGDQLVYSFCEAYASGTGGMVVAPPPPPYLSVPYGNGFSGGQPLGGEVEINPSTGSITGIAPPSGIYVVTVCVQEVRNGVVIATQRKDLQIFIAPCTVASALLQGEYILCDNTTTAYLQNLSSSPLINTYSWAVMNASGTTIHTSSLPDFNFTFPDTGLYTVSLVINRGEECSDSTASPAIVYPGFKPAFDVQGACIGKPTHFIDRTTSVYGTVNSWNWDFGEPSAVNDVSIEQSPTYIYPAMGFKDVRMIVTDSKGCRDTLDRTLSMFDKPPITLLFRDTLICTPDAVQLNASGYGNFSWTPNRNIVNAASPTPTVSPGTTTTYYVQLDDNGCINTDSVKVNVVNHVTLAAMADTVICSSDTIQLRVQSNGHRYQWSPAAQLIDPSIKNPFAVTPNTTIYTVTARIGSCSATEQITVNTVPYPMVFAGADTSICFGTSALLNGASDGSSFLWTPAASVSAATSLQTVAHPRTTTAYVLTARDNRGCPKPSQDTVLVNVLPEIVAFAGRDTAVVLGQRLQLNASGGTAYVWSPATGLSSVNRPDPIGIYNAPSEGLRYRVLVYDAEGCVDSAFVTVRVFTTKPSVFVPTAFTPNGDGRNDLLKPVLAGIREVEYFYVYNRWGQLVYQSKQSSPSWDGRVNGLVQPTSTFVWVVKATDYTGAPVFEKGTVTLIR
jgi:gliding motility-associated-like protein